MKMRKEHRVPLSAQCMDILETLQPQRRSDVWLFPKMEMTAHGFRSMASTLLNEQGYDFDVIEIQLAHVNNNTVRAVYNRAEYWEKRVKMIQEWADYLDALS